MRTSGIFLLTPTHFWNSSLVYLCPKYYSKWQFCQRFSTHYLFYQNFCCRNSCKIVCGIVPGGYGVIFWVFSQHNMDSRFLYCEHQYYFPIRVPCCKSTKLFFCYVRYIQLVIKVYFAHNSTLKLVADYLKPRSPFSQVSTFGML